MFLFNCTALPLGATEDASKRALILNNDVNQSHLVPRKCTSNAARDVVELYFTDAGSPLMLLAAGIIYIFNILI